MANKVIGVYEETPVKAGEIKTVYINDQFFEALNLWSMVKKWGLPNNVGWFNEPQDLIETIMALDDVSIQVDNEEQEERMAEAEAKK